MTEKEKGPHCCNPNSNDSQHKGSDTPKRVLKVYNLLATGGKFTAREINRICDTNDARKCVSELTHRHHIKVCREWHKDGYKLFWIESTRKEVAL